MILIALQHCFGLPCWHYQPLLDVKIAAPPTPPPYLFLKILKIEKRKRIVIKNLINREEKEIFSQNLENREEKEIFVSESHQSGRERKCFLKNLENQE